MSSYVPRFNRFGADGTELSVGNSTADLLIAIIVHTFSPTDLEGGKIPKSVIKNLFLDFGFAPVFALLNNTDADLSSKVSKVLLLSSIPTQMVDSSIVTTLFAVRDGASVPAKLFSDFKDFATFAKANLETSPVVAGYSRWWELSTLKTAGVQLSISANSTVQMIVDYLVGFTSNGVVAGKGLGANGSYNTKLLSTFEAADATADGLLLSDLQSLIGAGAMTVANLSSIFNWKSLLTGNYDVANIKATYSVSMSSLVSFLKSASGVSTLDVNGKFNKLNITLPSPAPSAKFTAIKIASLMNFSSADLLANSDFVGAIFSSNAIASDFESIFTGAYSNLSLANRLAGQTASVPLAAGATITLSDMVRRSLTSDSLASIISTILSLKASYTITGYTQFVQKSYLPTTVGGVTTPGVMQAAITAAGGVAANYKTSSADPNEVLDILTSSELNNLSALFSLSELQAPAVNGTTPAKGKSISVFNGTTTFNLDDLVVSNPLVTPSANVVATVARTLYFFLDSNNLPHIIQKIVGLGGVSISDMIPVLSVSSVDTVISALPGITEEDKLNIRLRNQNNNTNAKAITAVTQLLSKAQIFTVIAGTFSNNQSPLSLYLFEAFSSKSNMSLYLPSILDAVRNGVYINGSLELSAQEVRTAINKVIGGTGEPAPVPTNLNGETAIRVSSTVTGIVSNAPNFRSYEGQTLAGALMIYLLANQVSSCTMLDIFGANVTPQGASSPQMAATMRQTLGGINLEAVVFRSFFNLLRSITPAVLNAQWPVGVSRSADMADHWVYAFFDEFNNYATLVDALGGLGSNDTIKLLMSYTKTSQKVNISSGIITNGVDMVAIPGVWFTNPSGNYSGNGVTPPVPTAISENSYSELVMDALQGQVSKAML